MKLRPNWFNIGHQWLIWWLMICIRFITHRTSMRYQSVPMLKDRVRPGGFSQLGSTLHSGTWGGVTSKRHLQTALSLSWCPVRLPWTFFSCEIEQCGDWAGPKPYRGYQQISWCAQAGLWIEAKCCPCNEALPHTTPDDPTEEVTCLRRLANLSTSELL